jgi:hypothetical protein
VLVWESDAPEEKELEWLGVLVVTVNEEEVIKPVHLGLVVHAAVAKVVYCLSQSDSATWCCMELDLRLDNAPW